MVIHSLQKSAHHNGIEATVQRFDEEQGRYVIRTVVESNKKLVRSLVPRTTPLHHHQVCVIAACSNNDDRCFVRLCAYTLEKVCWCVGALVGVLVCWLVGWCVGWSVGVLVGWSAGW